MNTNIGKLIATLSETEQCKSDSLMQSLNANIKPSTELTRDDVHIRCMYIVSEELNSYGGRFPLEELYQIKELIIDSPVLIGHQKDQLPIGRNFHAEVIFKNNSHWVKSYFYWMKSADNSEDLRGNIDGGIIKECSIGFTFITPECSICQNDIRTCRHEPFRTYIIDGGSRVCHFYYKQIDKVLETSLVYRGAIPNTSISNALQMQDTLQSSTQSQHLTSLDNLSDQATYLLTPKYIGYNIFVTTTQNSIEIQYGENKFVPNQLLMKFFKEYPKNLKNQFGQLIGYRGKERCSLDELQKYLHGEKSIIRRLELRFYPTHDILKTDFQNIKVIRYKLARKHEIDKLSQSIMTKDGVQIYGLHNSHIENYSYLNNPLSRQPCKFDSYNVGYIVTTASNHDITLSIFQENNVKHFLIKRFNKNSFNDSKKFIVQKIPKENAALILRTKYNSGKLNVLSDSENSWQLELEGYLQNKIKIQPIILNGKERYLLYKSV